MSKTSEQKTFETRYTTWAQTILDKEVLAARQYTAMVQHAGNQVAWCRDMEELATSIS